MNRKRGQNIFYHLTSNLLPHYLVKFKCSTVLWIHLRHYVCTVRSRRSIKDTLPVKELIAYFISGSSSERTWKTVMNGNSLICWTHAWSRYTTAQLMCWQLTRYLTRW